MARQGEAGLFVRRIYVLSVALGVAAVISGSGPFGGSVGRREEPRVVGRPTEVRGVTAERPAEAPLAEAPGEVADKVGLVAEAPPTFGDAPASAALTPRAVDRSPARPGGQPGTWALIVGVNDYPGDKHDLLFAVNDAEDVDLALGSFGVPTDHRLVLRDGQATAAAIAAGLTWLTEHAGADAVAVVSFAGHAREHSPSRQAFLAADGVEVADSTLAELLRPLRARGTWLNFATCYGGGFDELLGPGRTLVAAAPAGQRAYENTDLGRSYLGEYMVRRGMLGTGNDAVASTFDDARQAIARHHPDRVPTWTAAAPRVDIRLRPPAATAPPTDEPSAQPADASAAPPGSSNQPPPPDERCSTLTLGVVRCGP